MKYLRKGERVTRFGVGLSYNPLSLICLAIVNVTRGGLPLCKALALVPSHAFEVYQIQGQRGSVRNVFFEMTFGGGYRGPMPLAQKARWSKARKWRRYDVSWLTMDTTTCEEKYGAALAWIKQGYAYDLLQLYRLWKEVRLGQPLIHADPEKGTCSEVVAIRAFPHYDFRRGPEVFDAITPYDLKQRIPRS